MGITLTNHMLSTDIPYSGFFNMRLAIARMLSDEIGDLYNEMIPAMHGTPAMQKIWEDGMNSAIDKSLDAHKKKMKKAVDFLFMPDSDGSISYGTCRLLAELIKSSEDKEHFKQSVFGYAGWGILLLTKNT